MPSSSVRRMVVSVVALDLSAVMTGGFHLGLYRSLGQLSHHLLDRRQALFDLLDADPRPGIDIAGFARRDLEGKLAMGRVSKRLACVEGATAGAPDIAAGA